MATQGPRVPGLPDARPHARHGRAQRHAGLVLRRRPVARPRPRGRARPRAGRGRRRPRRRRRRVDPARRRAGRRGRGGAAGAAGRRGARRRRAPGQHRHDAGRRSPSGRSAPAPCWSTTSAVASPTRRCSRCVARIGVPVVLMHWRGHSREMQHAGGVRRPGARGRSPSSRSGSAAAERAGVDPALVVLDPGIGFAKSAEHNWALLARLDELVRLGPPLLVGASRKAFLGALLADDAGAPRPPERPRRTPVRPSPRSPRRPAPGAYGCTRCAASADAVRVAAAWRARPTPVIMRVWCRHSDRTRSGERRMSEAADRTDRGGASGQPGVLHRDRDRRPRRDGRALARRTGQRRRSPASIRATRR